MEKTGYPHANELNWTPIHHNSQKIIQSGLKTYEALKLLEEKMTKSYHWP
jgi:hypothetical protein